MKRFPMKKRFLVALQRIRDGEDKVCVHYESKRKDLGKSRFKEGIVHSVYNGYQAIMRSLIFRRLVYGYIPENKEQYYECFEDKWIPPNNRIRRIFGFEPVEEGIDDLLVEDEVPF